MSNVAGKIQPSVDAIESLRAFFTERLYYYPHNGHDARGETKEISGSVNGIPYGNLYRPNDTFLVRDEPNKAGKLYHVAMSEPESPVLLVQEERPREIRHPRVRIVTGKETVGDEINYGEVQVGIRHRPTAKGAPPLQFENQRLLSPDKKKQLITVPFFRGGLFIHVASLDKYDSDFVFNQLNHGFDLESYIYRLAVRYRPGMVQLQNEEIAGVFHFVLNVDFTLALTENSAYEQMPPDSISDIVFDNLGLSGWSGVLEQFGIDPTQKRYAELVGHFDIQGEGHDLTTLVEPPSLLRLEGER